MRKTILVTGGAGFIGYTLCRALLARGHKVIALDNLSTGSIETVRLLKNNKLFTFIEADVRKPIRLRNEPELDEIYNMACPASPPAYQKDPIGTMMTCVLGADHVAQLADYYGATVLQASTSEIYGDPEVSPQPEHYRGNVSCTGIRACYDEGKRAAEALLFDYARTRGMKLRVARIFNTYGPHMDPKDGRVVSNFINQALRGDPITIYGSGQQTRSLCYVTDTVEGLITLMESKEIRPTNVGNCLELTVSSICNIILELAHSKSRVESCHLPQDDPQRRQPLLGRLQALGWGNKVTVEEGLRTTIQYFKGIM